MVSHIFISFKTYFNTQYCACKRGILNLNLSSMLISAYSFKPLLQFFSSMVNVRLTLQTLSTEISGIIEDFNHKRTV